jgi:hypothetical protein
MHHKRFDKLVADRLDHCYNLLTVKGEEYSRNNDRLWNFKRAAEMQAIAPAEALRGMLAKHLVSVFDMVDQVAAGDIPPPAMIDEKLSDAINYLLLLEVLIAEAADFQRPVTAAELSTLEAAAQAAAAELDLDAFEAECRLPHHIPDECLGGVCRRQHGA